MAGLIPRPSLRRLRYYYPPIIFYHYHFNRGNRKHGDKCPYRNSQKHCDKKKKSSGIGKATRKITDVEWGTRTNIAMVGLKVNANEEIYASSNTA